MTRLLLMKWLLLFLLLLLSIGTRPGGGRRGRGVIVAVRTRVLVMSGLEGRNGPWGVWRRACGEGVDFHGVGHGETEEWEEEVVVGD